MLDLTGKNALVTGIANNRSIAWGIAQQLHSAGANLGVTYLPDEKGRMEKKVADLVEPLSPSLFLPCNVQDDEQISSTFDAVREKWSRLDILIHCLAFANRDDLTGEFSATSRQGFQTALNISAYSLVQLAAQAKALMSEGGSIVTLTYLGGARVVPNYNVMGIAKAALEMNVRYLAAELGPQNIRVNGISAGPIRTLASSAVGGILDMIHHVEAVAPLRRTVTQTEVGNTAAFLCSDLASGVTGQILYVDSGYAIMGM
ncbi:MAG: enoyl-ACP reductase FabI [Cyanobacteria bacterium P01_H01_bin.119]